jgi:phage tail sheath protein FI
MAEILSPGVFIEEVPSAVQVVQPVSTSNMGIVGATQRGPTDEATLVTSFEQFTRIFGPIIAESRTGLSMAAYFSNGGRRAFVVRVMPSDATDASGYVTSGRRDDQSNTGDGSTAAVTDGTLTPLPLDAPIHAVSGTAGVTFRWRSDGTPVATEVMRNRDDSGDVIPVDGVAFYEMRVDPSSLPTLDSALPSIVPGGTMTLAWDPLGAGDVTLTLTQVGTTLVATGTTGATSTATLDLVTGFLSLTCVGVEIPDPSTTGTFRLSYTPGTAVRSVSDDGAGAIVDDGSGTLTGAGTITYGSTTVAPTYTFTASAGFEVGTDVPLLVDYAVQAWDLDPSSVGTWANDMRLDVSGNDDFFDSATNTYSRFNVNVLLLNTATNLFDIVETFEEITFTDTTSAQYFPDVLNDLSDLVEVVEPALNQEAPTTLSGEARSQVVAGGDDDGGNRQIDATLLDLPVAARSVSITYTDSTAVTRIITDDGAGNLLGDVDGAGVNTINYVTGVIDVTVSDPINDNQLVSVVYRSGAEESSHRETFAGGTDGTFTSPSTYGRSQFSDVATLGPSFLGLFALNRVDELMQVVIPDFAGDVQITKDLIDYVDSRETQPAGGDRFAILMVPQGSSAQEAVDFLRFDVQQNTKFGAMYWPWVKVADPLADNRPVVFPPLGHLAGIYARTDSTRNVGKAPGGTVDGALRFLVGLELVPTQGERDFVYPNRINPLISSPQTGLAVWGVRTFSLQSEWRYINARRLFMFVEKSIFNATHWIVFENNGPPLWARIKAQIQGFLTALFNDGLFAGSTPSQAFFVTVDESNNTPESIELGQVIIDIGIAPNKPAEFVRFRFQQKTLDS